MDFLVLCIYVVMLFVRPQDWIPAIHGVRLYDWVAMAGIVVLVTKLVKRYAHGRSPQDNPVFIATGLFALACLAPYVMQLFLSRLIGSTEMLIKQVLLPVMLIMVTANTRRRVDILMLLVLGSIALVGYHCYLQRTTGYGFNGQPAMALSAGRFTEHSRVRWFGIFNGANETGTLAAIGIVMSLCLIRRYWPNVLFGLVFGGLAVGFGYMLWWTRSRQAQIMLGAGVYMVLIPKKLKWNWLAFVAGALVFFAAAQYLPRWLDVGQDKSVRKRATTITQGLRVFKKSPVFGVGMGKGYDVIAATVPKRDRVNIGFHNSYLQVLVESGMVGMTSYMAIYLLCGLQLYFIWRCNGETKEEKRDIALAKLLLAVITVMGVGSFFQNRPTHIDTFVYLGIAAAFGFRMQTVFGERLPRYFHARWFVSRTGLALMVGAAAGMVTLIHLTSKAFWRM